MGWFLSGLLVGIFNLVSAVTLVAQLSPAEPRRLRWRVVCRHLVGYVLVALLLGLALQQSVLASFFAGGGVWVTRWLGVYLGSTGKLNWLWSR
jgi:hypothetical protein